MIFPFKPSTYKGFPIAMFDSQVLKGSYGPISHDVNHESQDLYRIYNHYNKKICNKTDNHHDYESNENNEKSENNKNSEKCLRTMIIMITDHNSI